MIVVQFSSPLADFTQPFSLLPCESLALTVVAEVKLLRNIIVNGGQFHPRPHLHQSLRHHHHLLLSSSHPRSTILTRNDLNHRVFTLPAHISSIGVSSQLDGSLAGFGHCLKEGKEIFDGLALEKVLEEGEILGVPAHHFLMDLLQGRDAWGELEELVAELDLHGYRHIN